MINKSLKTDLRFYTKLFFNHFNKILKLKKNLITQIIL